MLQLIILKEGEGKIMKRASIIFTVFILTMPIFAKPSWCKNAHTSVEKRICKNRALIDLDYEENAIYTRIRDYLKKNNRKLYKMLLKDEEEWVRARDTNCYGKSDSCIAQEYQDRIKYLYSLVDN
jgi:uncharacterized protein